MTAPWFGFTELTENRSALAAARRTLEQLTSSRTTTAMPLLFHGLSGTGKTLLTQAMVLDLTHRPDGLTAQVLAAGEIPLVAADDAAEDVKHLEAVDLLVLEDLQHLPRRKSQSLCRLLDRRAERRRPTVLTSTVGPAALARLPRRLTSRLAAGLVVQLEPIGKDSRRLVLEEAVTAMAIRLAPDALDELTKRTAGGGLRPVLGALKQLKILIRSTVVPVTAERLIEILQEQESLSTISQLERILLRSAERFGVKPVEVLGSSRRKDLVSARQTAIYLARELTDLSLPHLGRFFGNRDHTTILHAHRKIAGLAAADRTLARTLKDLKAELE